MREGEDAADTLTVMPVPRTEEETIAERWHAELQRRQIMKQQQQQHVHSEGASEDAVAALAAMSGRYGSATGTWTRDTASHAQTGDARRVLPTRPVNAIPSRMDARNTPREATGEAGVRNTAMRGPMPNSVSDGAICRTATAAMAVVVPVRRNVFLLEEDVDMEEGTAEVRRGVGKGSAGAGGSDQDNGRLAVPPAVRSTMPGRVAGAGRGGDAEKMRRGHASTSRLLQRLMDSDDD